MQGDKKDLIKYSNAKIFITEVEKYLNENEFIDI
jgi:hypothetical protein